MKIDNVHVRTDGSIRGTQVLVADDPLESVQAIRREGRNLFITIRVRDPRIETAYADGILDTILAGDFALALQDQPALRGGELLTPKRTWA